MKTSTLLVNIGVTGLSFGFFSCIMLAVVPREMYVWAAIVGFAYFVVCVVAAGVCKASNN